MVSVRDIVHDVDAAIAFYCQHLGFREQMHPAPTFAMLVRDKLRLLLSSPTRYRHRGRRLADPARRPFWKSCRTVPADPTRSSIALALRRRQAEWCVGRRPRLPTEALGAGRPEMAN
jgi:hypothetical protein